MSDHFIIPELNDCNPSPIPLRECKCGCGHVFQPRRFNQVFISKKHADFYHYHQVKKPKNKIRNEIENIHRKNDRICSAHFNAQSGSEVNCSLAMLKNEGFNDQYIQGTITELGKKYVLTYHHMYTVFAHNGIPTIKIKKR